MKFIIGKQMGSQTVDIKVEADWVYFSITHRPHIASIHPHEGHTRITLRGAENIEIAETEEDGRKCIEIKDLNYRKAQLQKITNR